VPPFGCAESRESIVAQAGCQVELLIQIELTLREIAFDMAKRFEFETVLRNGVLDRQRSRSDEPFSLRRQLTVAAGIQVLADRKSSIDILAAVARRRGDQVVIDDEVVLIGADDLTRLVASGGDRKRLKPGIVVIISAYCLLDTEPRQRMPIEIEVRNSPTELTSIAWAVEDEKRVVVVSVSV